MSHMVSHYAMSIFMIYNNLKKERNGSKSKIRRALMLFFNALFFVSKATYFCNYDIKQWYEDDSYKCCR